MTNTPRLYVIGASCSGVSTLGATLSEQFAVPLLDVDDFYWMPTDPPFTTKRPPEDRVRLIKEQQAQSKGWVLSGSFIGWGDTLIDNVDLIAFLYTPTAVRLQRLDRREALRHGDRILPGGDMYEGHLAFRDWASHYVHLRSLGAIWNSMSVGSMHNPFRCLDLTAKKTLKR